MPKVKLNPAIAGMRGKLGDMVHRQLWGQQIASRLPDFSKRQLSQKQRTQVGRFTTSGLKWTGLPAEVKARYQGRAKELQMPPCALYQKTSARPPSVEAAVASLADVTIEAIAENWPGQHANRMQILGVPA